ncbi:MAG: TolC family protein [Gemmataceae bacterium]|nr:TolC family protein [Gemmataceae bacterium]
MDVAIDCVNLARVTRVAARATLCGVVLLLASCQIPKVRQPDPGPGLPPSFNGWVTPDNSAQLKVEEFFNDPVLIGLIHQGLTGNQELKLLTQDVQIANNEVLLRRGAYLPFITTRAGAGLDRSSAFTPIGAAERQLRAPGDRRFPDPLPDFLVAANFTWQVDIWRKLRNARDAATLRYFATAEGRNYVVTRMVAEIAERYYTLMALDQRMVVLNETIKIQQDNYEIAKLRRDLGRGTELPVQRFLAEVRRSEAEKLVVRQEIVEAENRINFLLGRNPQPVERPPAAFLDLNINTLAVGVPAQLLLNRPDIRQAEREVAAAGLEIKIARAEFFPQLDITGGIGYRAFNPRYLFNPEALIGNLAGDLVAPLVNRTAIRAVFLTANARQLQSIYNYQRVVLDAYTEVINRVASVENYRRSVELRRQQMEALEASVDVARRLFQNARVEYVEVLLAVRDLLEARTAVIEAKRQYLVGIVYAYQALGGGGNLWQLFNSCQSPTPAAPPGAALPPGFPPQPAPGNLPPPRPVPGDVPLPRPAPADSNQPEGKKEPERKMEPEVKPAGAVLPPPEGVMWSRSPGTVPPPADK